MTSCPAWPWKWGVRLFRNLDVKMTIGVWFDYVIMPEIALDQIANLFGRVMFAQLWSV
jgi:hypothetical protein